MAANRAGAERSAGRRGGHRSRTPVGRGDLWALFGFVVVLQFGFPVTAYGQVWTGLYMGLYVGMLLFGIRTARREEHHTVPYLVLAAAVLFFAGWVTIAPTERAPLLGMYLSIGTFLAALLAALIRFAFTPRRATGIDLVVAVVTAYLVIGGVFVAIFGTVETLQPGSIVDGSVDDPMVAWQQLIYYSYVTLATLGYGEVLPISMWARSFAVLETVTGTLFIAVVIARFVGDYQAQANRVPDPAEAAGSVEQGETT